MNGHCHAYTDLGILTTMQGREAMDSFKQSAYLAHSVQVLRKMKKYEDRKCRDQGGDVDGEQGRKDEEKMKGEGVGGDG